MKVVGLSGRIINGTLAVRVTASASSERIVITEHAVRIYVSAAPEDGKANAAVARLLATALGLPRSALALVKGETSRDKVFRIG